jgi:hypothetical protein
MFERFSRKSMAATGAALLAALGVSGVAIAQAGNGVPSPSPSPSKAQSTVAPAQAKEKEKPGVEEPAASEQSGSEQPGSEVANDDGPGGHADEPANPNADHQFQGKE